MIETIAGKCILIIFSARKCNFFCESVDHFVRSYSTWWNAYTRFYLKTPF